MSIIEQIKELSIEMEDNESYRKLEESLELYHQMVQSGQLVPRQNQVENIYVPLEFKSNYS